MPFIEEILNNTQSIVCDLQPLQVLIIIYSSNEKLTFIFWGELVGRLLGTHIQSRAMVLSVFFVVKH